MTMRERTANTHSYKAALPARSPSQMMVHSTWRAPFITADKEIEIRTSCILRREFDGVRVLPRAFHRTLCLLDLLIGLHAELHLHVDGRGRDEGVDARRTRALQCLRCAIDVLVDRPREAAHGALGHRLGDGLHRLEVTGARDRKTGLDDIDTHALE